MTHPALIEVLDQLKAIENAPRYVVPPVAAPAGAPEPARRGHAEIVAVAEADRVAVPVGESVDAIRAAAGQIIADYLAEPIATRRLLLQLPAGVGKTYLGVEAAHKAQAAGLRVAYVMPRHDFFDTLIDTSAKQGYTGAYWHHWQPRQAGAEVDAEGETCHLSKPIGQWIQKGHPAMNFCASVCGWKHINNRCLYHRQKQTIELKAHDGIWPIVAIQHAHIVTGHALMSDFDLIIGDESPLAAYPHLWHIPTRWLAPAGKLSKALEDKPAAAFMPILDRTARHMAHDITIDGPALLDVLGGAEHVIRTIRATLFEESTVKIYTAEAVEHVPYDYLAHFCAVLLAEAKEHAAGRPYIRRALLQADGLRLLLKRDTTSHMPPKTIWLDATASPELYHRVTNWRIESFYRSASLAGPIVQLTEGVFSKTSMVANKRPTAKAKETARIIESLIAREGYADPLIVSYSDLAPLFKDRKFAYFHANRGTNDFENCDAVFILGTPQPPTSQIELAARMFFAQRMTPFNDLWCKKVIPYAGQDRGYIASGLWADEDLALVLDQLREQEIVQSAHRVRPVLSSKPIWLFTAMPVAALPPTHLYSLLDALGVDGEGIDAGTFLDAMDIANVQIDQHGHCTAQDMIDLLEVSRATAYKYLAALAQYDPERYAPMEVRTIGKGRPKRAIGRG